MGRIIQNHQWLASHFRRHIHAHQGQHGGGQIGQFATFGDLGLRPITGRGLFLKLSQTPLIITMHPAYCRNRHWLKGEVERLCAKGMMKSLPCHVNLKRWWIACEQ